MWVTTIVAASTLENTVVDNALLVIPADWNISGNFDRCTLMGIRGWLGYSQQAAATAGDATAYYTAIYVTDAGVAANSMDPSLATDYTEFDVLWTDGFSLTQTTGTAGFTPSRQLEVKTRRKLTSQSSVRLSSFIDSDTGAPRVNTNGVIRTLLKLDSA